MRSRPAVVALIAALLTGLVPGVTLAAGHGSYVITADDCGRTVSQNAVLLSNIDCSSAGTITAGADISISMGGHTIIGSASSPVIATNGYNVTISGGKLLPGRSRPGIDAEGGTVSVGGMTINQVGSATRSGYGIYEYRAVLNVSSSTMTALSYGIYADGGTVAVSGTQLNQNEYGFYGADCDSVSLTGVTASSNIYDGIATVHGTLATISNSVADRNGWRGISLDTAKAGTVRISGNYARYNAMDGVSLIEPYDQYNTSSGSSVGSTVASSNGGNGFYVLGSGNLTFTGDTAAGNGAFGFDLDGVDVGTVAATNNLAKANVDGGYFTTGYAVGGTGNVATGNGTPQCVNWTCRIK